MCQWLTSVKVLKDIHLSTNTFKIAQKISVSLRSKNVEIIETGKGFGIGLI